MSELPTDAIQKCFRRTADEGYEEVAIEASTQLQALLDEIVKWRNIADDLYKRVDVYGEICLCNDYNKDWCGIHAYDDEIRRLKEKETNNELLGQP